VPVLVARRTADGLNQTALGAQKAFLVGVQNRHERDFRDVEAFAQQVDAHEHIEGAQAQIAQDLDALDGVDVGVQVTHLDAVLGEVVGELFGHALGQGRDQHALVLVDADADLLQHVVDLVRGGTHFHDWVHETRGPHHLLDNLTGMLLLVGSRRG
jgi:hypothetical protein